MVGERDREYRRRRSCSESVLSPSLPGSLHNEWVKSGVPAKVSISCPTCGTRHDEWLMLMLSLSTVGLSLEDASSLQAVYVGTFQEVIFVIVTELTLRSNHHAMAVQLMSQWA